MSPSEPESPRAGGIAGRAEALLAWGALVLVALSTLITQPYWVGFASGHHGWVSSHYLAILRHSEPQTGFVGYTLDELHGDDRTHGVYWNRYPAAGSVAQKWLTLGYSDRLATMVHVSRQFMNLVFVLILALGYVVLNDLLKRPAVSMGVVFLGFSSEKFLYYKDMVFAEQVSVLASLITLFAIQRYYRSGRFRPLFGWVTLALCIGRGFPVLALLLVWTVYEGLRRLIRLRSPASGPPVARTSALLLLFGFGLTFVHTFYNVAMEARYNDVSLAETSIVEAATRRGGLDSEFNAENRHRRAWRRFIPQQIERMREVMFPMPREFERRIAPKNNSPVDCAGNACHGLVRLAVAAGFIALGFRLRSWGPGRRFVAAALLVYGVAWLFPARNLAIFHGYTAWYYYGLPLALWGALLAFVPRKAGYAVLAAGLGLFLVANGQMNTHKQWLAGQTNWIIGDFQTIADAIEPGAAVYYDGGYRELLHRVPYITGFALPDNPVADDPLRAEWAISKTVTYPGSCVTPDNRGLFLFRRPAALPETP